MDVLYGVVFLLIQLELLTVAELVVFHVDGHILQLSWMTWQVALHYLVEAIVSCHLQELILVGLVSQVLRVLRVLRLLFVKSYLASLVDRERNLLRVLNQPAPLV